MRSLPQPIEYLDPLTDLDDCYYYAVPRFFDHGHPNTRWLTGMIVQNRADRVLRKMELTPELFSGAYYQIVDDPRVYWGFECNERPVFHRQAVLYFTTVAAAMYLGQESFVEAMLRYQDVNDQPMHSPSSVQYATHIQDTQNGDIHAFPLCAVMIRCCKVNCALPMLRYGWNPHIPMAMPFRRRHERRALYVSDWLDYALWLLGDRPAYPLSSLVLGMARDINLWRHRRMPIAQLSRQAAAYVANGQQQPPTSGIIDVEDLPLGGPRMVGVLSLADMVKEYNKYQQYKLSAQEIDCQLRRAQAMDRNREQLLAQSQDYSEAFLKEPEQPTTASAFSRSQIGKNNSACRPSICCSKPTPEPKLEIEPDYMYASEPVRILHYALKKDRCSRSIRQCLAAFDVYLKRNFFLVARPLPRERARLRDMRNAVVLLLNLVQKQLDEVHQIAQLAYQPIKQKHSTKNPGYCRRQSCLRNIQKQVEQLTRLLLHSKQFTEFAVNESWPPYPELDVDFRYAKGLSKTYNDIRLAIAREFNSDEQSCRYLSLDMLRQLRTATKAGGRLAGGLHLRLRLGQPPPSEKLKQTNDAELELENDDVESGSSKQRGSCCQRRHTSTKLSQEDIKKRKAAVDSTKNYSNISALIGDCGRKDADLRKSPPSVTFVRVARPKARIFLASKFKANKLVANNTMDIGLDVDLPSVTIPEDKSDTISEPYFLLDNEILLPDLLPIVDVDVDIETSVAPDLDDREAIVLEAGATAEAATVANRSQFADFQMCHSRGHIGGSLRWLAGLGRQVFHRIGRVTKAHQACNNAAY